MTQTSKTPINVSLDVKGLNCPLPILKTKKSLNDMNVGEVLEIFATDPGSVPDFNAFCRQTGHELLLCDEGSEVFRFLIRKNAKS